MNSTIILKISFVLWVAALMIGAPMKIMHQPNADYFLKIGVGAMVVFLICCIYEVVKSTRIKTNEKVMWVLGFLFFSLIAGMVYLISGKKK